MAQEALLARLARTMRENDSWTGETHLQKATYLLEVLAEVPFDFDFILYKHGPFSFELRDELGNMQADRYIQREPQDPPYGPRFSVTDRGLQLEERYAKTMARYGSKVDWIAAQLHNKGVAALERLATALWVTTHQGRGLAVEERADLLRRIKRHVSGESAVEAVREIDELLAAAPE
jgi:uncharacterized protein YwgA